MKLEMYVVRSELSNVFANVLPPLKRAAEKMVEEETGKKLAALCDQVDSLLFNLHKLLPREVEIVESVAENEKDTPSNKVWHRNGHQLKLINGGKEDEGPFTKGKGV
jgi:hypothetical protein